MLINNIVRQRRAIYFIFFMVIGFATNAGGRPGIISVTDSGPFYLQGGTVPHKNGQLNISLKTLPLGRTFYIICDIENPNYNKPSPVVIEFWRASLNGKASSTNQYLLDNHISKYERRMAMNSNEMFIRFTNYDDNDSVYVKNCIATYLTK